ncbi:hypothetical protein BKA66DRAFT_570165 [Pyrenochaeta sp. MPI-SDFR-AT-0127]|nr:hypothetical protein BKA66DRAFT_570165 [Pyrenochaeta sp. MPI-SDFR-AT-0127]
MSASVLTSSAEQTFPMQDEKFQSNEDDYKKQGLSSQATMSYKKVGFLTLPGEVRNIIYCHATVEDDLYMYTYCRPFQYFALTQVCQQIRIEYYPLWFASRTSRLFDLNVIGNLQWFWWWQDNNDSWVPMATYDTTTHPEDPIFDLVPLLISIIYGYDDQYTMTWPYQFWAPFWKWLRWVMDHCLLWQEHLHSTFETVTLQYCTDRGQYVIKTGFKEGAFHGLSKRDAKAKRKTISRNFGLTYFPSLGRKNE